MSAITRQQEATADGPRVSQLPPILTSTLLPSTKWELDSFYFVSYDDKGRGR